MHKQQVHVLVLESARTMSFFDKQGRCLDLDTACGCEVEDFPLRVFARSAQAAVSVYCAVGFGVSIP